MKKSTTMSSFLFALLIIAAIAKHFCFTYNNSFNCLSLDSYRYLLKNDFIRETELILTSIVFILSSRFLCKSGKESIPLQMLSGCASVAVLNNAFFDFCRGISTVKGVLFQTSHGDEANGIIPAYNLNIRICIFMFSVLICISLIRNVAGIGFMKIDIIKKFIDNSAVFLLLLECALNLLFINFSIIVSEPRSVSVLAEQVLAYLSRSLLTAGIASHIMLRELFEEREDGLIQIVKGFINKDNTYFYRFKQWILESDVTGDE